MAARMNSYQKLKQKSKQREQELLSDIHDLIGSNEQAKFMVKARYRLQFMIEKHIMFGGRPPMGPLKPLEGTFDWKPTITSHIVI